MSDRESGITSFVITACIKQGSFKCDEVVRTIMSFATNSKYKLVLERDSKNARCILEEKVY